MHCPVPITKPEIVFRPKAADIIWLFLEHPCVGDSRTVYTRVALGASAPSNVEFIAKAGEGLDWFKSSGYKTLYRSVAKRPRTEKKGSYH